MPDLDNFKQRLDAAEQRYNRAAGGVDVLREEHESELRRLLEAHGVSDYEALTAVREHLAQEVVTAETAVEEAFREADL